MAFGKKLTELPEKASAVVDADLLLVTDSADGLSKKITGDKLPEDPSAKWLDPVRVRTTANVDLAGGGLAAGTTHDDIVLDAGDRVLAMVQDDESEVGIYLAPASGAASRASDLPVGAFASLVTVLVDEGTAHEDTAWICKTNRGVDEVGTDDLEFGPFPSGGDDCCAAMGAYSADNFTPGAATPVGQLEGIDAKLGELGAQAVTVDVDGVLNHASANEVGYLLEIEVNKAAGNYVAERTDVTQTAAPGAANKLREWSVGGVPKVSIAASGAVSIHNPGTPSLPALEIDRGAGGKLGLDSPADNQIAISANGESLIVDNSGANPTLLPDDDLTWDLAAAGARIRRAFISTLVDPLIAAAADPVNRAVSFVLSSLTAARTITVPDHDYTLNTLRESGTQVLTMGAMADGLLLARDGTTLATRTAAQVRTLLGIVDSVTDKPVYRVVAAQAPVLGDNLTLSTDLENGDSLGGVTLATGDVVLLTAQTDGSQNGPWVVAASGAPVRPSWFPAAGDPYGFRFYCDEGYFVGRTFTVQNAPGGTIDTTALVIHMGAKTHRGAAAPTASEDYGAGFHPGDSYVWENVDKSHTYTLAGEDAASPVWRQTDIGAKQQSTTTATWTLDAEDAGNTYFLSDGTAVILTINTGLPDMVVTFVADGAGPIRANAGTATRRGPAAFNQGSNVFETAEQYSEMQVRIRNGVAYFIGDLAAAP